MSSTAQIEHDVIVLGAGLVGSALSLALAGEGLRTALVEPREPEAEPHEWGSRIYAIGPGRSAFLDRWGAWSAIPRERIAAVTGMLIFTRGNEPALEFSAYRSGVRALATIVEERAMRSALEPILRRQAHLRLFRPARATSLEWFPDRIAARLGDGGELLARLAVGADGVRSQARQWAGMPWHERDYDQRGVVANFACGRAHRGIARQWFREDGVLALLPLPGRRVSMVWSANLNQGERLMAMSSAELCAAVAEASGQVLGDMELITPAAAFPLRFCRVERLVKPRFALAGDAAHGVHPLAGQGVNLGLRDAEQLAKVLSERGPREDIGDEGVLRRFERARREDILGVQWATDGLQRMFASRQPAMALLGDCGLRVTDRLAPLKKFLARAAMA